LLALGYNPTFDKIMGAAAEGPEMESIERFAEVMSDEESTPQTLTPYDLDRTTGFYVKVHNVEGLLRMLVFQGPEQAGEKSVCVADLLFTRDQFQEMARVMGMPNL
jgi:hypothetical protein